MEETPESGLTEEIQRSQIDLGAIIWGTDVSTDSVSQEVTHGESQEDSACLSEAEQDLGLSTVMLPSVDLAIAACVEMEHPCDLPDSETPAMETGGLVRESQEDVKKPEEEEEKQKTEDSIWAGVETCEKVEAEAIGVRALGGTEKFEEKTCESIGNRIVGLLKTVGKQDQETLKVSEEETRKDLSAECKERIKTNEKYLEQTDIIEKDMKSVDQADEFSDRDQELDGGIQVVIKNFEITDGSGAKPASHTNILNLPPHTDFVSNTEDANPGGRDLAGKDIKKNLIDPPNHDIKDHSAQGSADVEDIPCEAVLHALGRDRDGNQAVVLSIKHEAAAHSRTDLNYALETNTNRRDWCLCKGEDALIKGPESTVPGNHSHTINLTRIAKADSWGTDPGRIWQPDLDSAVSSVDILEFSGIPDGQESGSASCLDSINHWPIRDVGGIDNCWEHSGIVGSKKELGMDLLADVVGEQTITSCWEQSQELARRLVLGTSHNTSTESSTSSQDNDTNNSDLSEDEIANQRYGLLYQEIEADKEEVLIPVCSID